MPRLIYHGQSCFEIHTTQAKLIVDPWLDDNPVADIAADDVECDVILVTHGHSDHLGDTVLLARRTGALVVSNFEIVTYLQKQGLEKLHPLHIGGGKSFSWGRVKLTMAMHGSSLPDGGYGGVAAGVLLNLGGTTIYHAGDTGLFYDMKLIGDARIDLAMIPIGDNFTMGPDDAVKAVSLLRPKMVAPMHYNTFDVIEQDPNEWAAAVERETSAKPKVLEPGQTIILE